jgi:hypothetical protein
MGSLSLGCCKQGRIWLLVWLKRGGRKPGFRVAVADAEGCWGAGILTRELTDAELGRRSSPRATLELGIATFKLARAASDGDRSPDIHRWCIGPPHREATGNRELLLEAAGCLAAAGSHQPC